MNNLKSKGKKNSMQKRKIVALGGDGVGPEVVSATCGILKQAGFALDIVTPPVGESALKIFGTVLPKETKELCESSDAILFGAVTTETIIIYLRWDLGNYVNVRPGKYYPGANSPLKNPEGIDLVVLRENSEGLYTFAEGDLSLLRERLPDYRTRHGKAFADYGEGKFAVRIISNNATRRYAKFACEYAMGRKQKGYPGNITIVSKSNMMRESCGLFESILEEELKKYPSIIYTRYYIDDMSRRLVRRPQDFDVVATSNLFGDILTDLAAEVVGGLGIAGSACLGGKVPYFESVHGTAPKYAGKNIVNPTATILSAKYMLDYLNMDQEAASLEKSLATVYRNGTHLTRDQGGVSSTTEFADAVLREIR